MRLPTRISQRLRLIRLHPSASPPLVPGRRGFLVLPVLLFALVVRTVSQPPESPLSSPLSSSFSSWALLPSRTRASSSSSSVSPRVHPHFLPPSLSSAAASSSTPPPPHSLSLRRRRFRAQTEPRSLPPFHSDTFEEGEHGGGRRRVRRKTEDERFASLASSVPALRIERPRNTSEILLRLLQRHSLGVLAKVPQPSGYKFNVLEIASGKGEVTELSSPLEEFLRRRDPYVKVVWQPSERSQARMDSFRSALVARNVSSGKRGCCIRHPIEVDTSKTKGRWTRRALTRIRMRTNREEMYSVVVTSNLLHQAPFSTFEGLLSGAVDLLEPGGLLVIHGCYTIDGVDKQWTLDEFKRWLYSRDPWWGIHDLRDVLSAAEDYGFRHLETLTIPTPASFVPTVVDTALDGRASFVSMQADDFIMILSNDRGQNPHKNLPPLPEFKNRSSLAQAFLDDPGEAWESLGFLFDPKEES